MEKTALRESKNDDLIDILLKDPNYKINKDGTIQTRITLNGQGVGKDWRTVGYQKADGYVRFRYKGEFLFIQRVIYRAFKGPLDKTMTINHIDLDRGNNHPDNLEMITQGDNNKKKRKKYRKASIVQKVLNKLGAIPPMTDTEFQSAKKEFDKLNKSQMKAISNIRDMNNMRENLENLVRNYKITIDIFKTAVIVSVKPQSKWITYEVNNRGKIIKDEV